MAQSKLERLTELSVHVDAGKGVAIFLGTVFIPVILFILILLCCPRFFHRHSEPQPSRHSIALYRQQPPVNTTDSIEEREGHAVVVVPPLQPGEIDNTLHSVVVYATNKNGVVIKVEATAENKDDACPVCLDPLSSKEKLAALPCLHPFHETCLKDWLSKRNKAICPICQTEFSMYSSVSTEQLLATENSS